LPIWHGDATFGDGYGFKAVTRRGPERRAWIRDLMIVIAILALLLALVLGVLGDSGPDKDTRAACVASAVCE
jgi:hypothetical protein